MYFKLGKQLLPCRAEELQEPDPFVAVLQPEEALRSDLLSDIDAVFLEKCVRSRYCRAEVYPDWILGTIAVPKKGMDGYLTIAYCLRMRSVVLWDTAGVSQKIAQKIAETRKWKRPSAGQFFCDFLDLLTENDFLHLEEMENRIAKLETGTLSGNCPNFNHHMMRLRKAVMLFSRYYSQLTDALRRLLENENGYFDRGSCSRLQICVDRLARLQGESRMLREYLMQVREVYQTQLDIRQNRIMKLLTVIATIFLPLTLLTGWYGMNFSSMPELHWQYGYLMVIGVSVLIVVGCIWLCKKKRFF